MTYDKQEILDVLENLVYTAKGNVYRDGDFRIYKLKSTLVIELPNETREAISGIILEDINLSDNELKGYASWYSDLVKEVRHIYNKYKFISPSNYFM